MIVKDYTDLFNSLKEKAIEGKSSSIDYIMSVLSEADLPTTRAVDFYLGFVKSVEGIERIEHYLFSGSLRQRNYSALFFARNDEWAIINRAYVSGCIDAKQAYSR